MHDNLIINARRFARDAHKAIFMETVSGDSRPQIEHLQEVADLVWASGGTEIEIAAAWLHDTVEDTKISLGDITEKFGVEVAQIVNGLTDDKDLRGLPNAIRKAKQAERVASKSASVKRIKLADQTSNVRFLRTDPQPNWPVSGNRDYIIGARKIADQCKGLSDLLDKLFDTEFKMAAMTYQI